MRIAVYPGSFDPITNGHVDMAKRALKMFDKLIIIVANNIEKKYFFTIDERVNLVKKTFAGMDNVEVIKGEGLTAVQAQELGAVAIIRGLRMVSDYEYEYQYAAVNEYLAPNIDMVFLMSHKEYSFISSSRVKEIFSLGGDVKHLVPQVVYDTMVEKEKNKKK